MKVALYARVSTADKNQNPQVQLDRLREFCKLRGYEIVREYVDTASGFSRKRAGFKAVLEDGRKRQFDGVVITKLDRLGRNVHDLVETLGEFEVWRIELICLDQPIDTTTPSGKMLYHILSAVAEFERDLISARIKEGLEFAKRHGKRLGRPTIDCDKNVVLNLRLQGKSIRDIAKQVGLSKSKICQICKDLKVEAG
jgi:DNA invertase Pin-like site-specific DNA recombinase